MRRFPSVFFIVKIEQSRMSHFNILLNFCVLLRVTNYFIVLFYYREISLENVLNSSTFSMLYMGSGYELSRFIFKFVLMLNFFSYPDPVLSRSVNIQLSDKRIPQDYLIFSGSNCFS
jgi:hypothetical protein